MMLSFLPAIIIGIISATLHLFSIALATTSLFVVGALRFLTPNKHWRHQLHILMNQLPNYWTSLNYAIQSITTKTIWDVKGLENLNRNDWYLMISNHQSWVDILVLQRISCYKIPMPKFFLKKELLWALPFGGLACWLLDFPFMHRHSKSALMKNPELKGKDIAATKKACEKFKEIPTTVINFVEGTRFTKEKQQNQQSPYQYLLRPKAGGIAFALATIGNEFHKIINVTIIYPDNKSSVWDFFCGKVKKIIVRAEVLPITPDLLGDYENNREFRSHFQKWLNHLWQQKDQLIDVELHSQSH